MMVSVAIRMIDIPCIHMKAHIRHRVAKSGTSFWRMLPLCRGNA